MGTLEELQKIKDDTDFETLVVLYLRRQSPKLKGLIHTGINAEGKVIKCPVDALLHVIGPPSELVHVAATITDSAEIRRKWLGGKKAKGKYEPGDIAKAHEEFEKWTNEPNAKRKLYLGWNRPLENDTDLYREIKKRCDDLKIELELIEASQLVDFLDRDPEGQYLRQEFLGIDALRLSESLLQAIAIRSLNSHSKIFRSSDRKRQVEIRREAEDALKRMLRHKALPLIGVVAPSGAGKSTLVNQCGEKTNSEDGICIWVPAEDIQPHTSPGTLLLNTVRRFYPALNERAGDDALQIASKLSSGLILIADDINRAKSPSETLEAIQSCSSFDIESTGRSNPRIRFVVPMWPTLAAEISESRRQNWDLIQLDYYSRSERELLAKERLPAQQAEALAMLDTLGGDPFLCHLALSSFEQKTLLPTTSRATIIKSIVTDVLTRATSDAAKSHNESTQDEFARALDRGIEHMLAADDPEPSWESLKATLGDRASTLLLQLGYTNRIGWVEQQFAESHWRWKHDRLRDAIIGRWLATRAASVKESADNAELVKLMTIPGAAEAWAWALAFSDSGIQHQLIEMLGKHQPLALAASIALTDFAEHDDSTELIVNPLQDALAPHSLTDTTFVERPWWPVLYRLTQLNSPLVLRITDKLERNWHVNIARFRNGDTHAGVLVLRRFFGPFGMKFSPVDRAAEEYARLNDNRRAEVAKQLQDELRDPNQLIPVLALCGYLRWEELTDLAWNAWQAVSEEEKQHALTTLIWTLCRCAPASDQARLEEALLRARLWSNEEDADHTTARYEKFTQQLRFMLNGDITVAASKTLAKVTTDHEDLRNEMLQILRSIDMPATMEAYVRLTAKFNGSWWDRIEGVDHHSNKVSDHRSRIPVTSAARERLWQIIASNEPENVRKTALLLWKRFPVQEDLERLQAFAESDVLFDEILKLRLRLRDASAAPLLIQRIQTAPGVWTPYAYLVYEQPGVSDALFENLEVALGADILESQYVERIPENLPTEGVRRLVAEKREILRNSPNLLHSLWRSDVSEALSFLREVLPNVSDKDLKRFAFGNGNSYPVSERMFAVVAPLVDRLEEMDRFWLISTFINAGLAPLLESYGMRREIADTEGSLRYWLNRHDAREIFDEAARTVRDGPDKVERSPDYHEIERGDKRLSFDAREALREWIEQSTEPDKIVVAGVLLARIGVGADAAWWARLDPGVDGNTNQTWADTLYILRRRRWQKHD